MKTTKSVLWGSLLVVVVGIAALFVGGQTQRADSFTPSESKPLHLTNAIVWINPPSPDGPVQNNVTLRWYRPDAIRPMLNLFVCEPSFDSVAIHGVTITLDRTNAINLSEAEMSDPEYGLRLKFKPYDDPVGFRERHPMYSKADPRHAFFMPFLTNPKLTKIPAVGTKVDVRVDFSIMSKEQLVCKTNVQAAFVLERQETRMTWGSMLFLKMFMPRF